MGRFFDSIMGLEAFKAHLSYIGLQAGEALFFGGLEAINLIEHDAGGAVFFSVFGGANEWLASRLVTLRVSSEGRRLVGYCYTGGGIMMQQGIAFVAFGMEKDIAQLIPAGVSLALVGVGVIVGIEMVMERKK